MKIHDKYLKRDADKMSQPQDQEQVQEEEVNEEVHCVVDDGFKHHDLFGPSSSEDEAENNTKEADKEEAE